MPLIHVYLKKGVTKEYKQAISDGIYKAMIDVLGLPLDDYNQLTFEMEPEDMRYDPNYFGEHRSEKVVFIQLAFNDGRPAELKTKLFETIANNLVENPGMRIQDVMMLIMESGRENWWAYARTVNPETGLDSRMAAPTA